MPRSPNLKVLLLEQLQKGGNGLRIHLVQDYNNLTLDFLIAALEQIHKNRELPDLFSPGLNGGVTNACFLFLAQFSKG